MYQLIEYITKALDIIAVVILVIGSIKMVIKYVISEVKDISKTDIKTFQVIRCELGVYILLSLDFLIAKDIIHTVTDLSQDSLLELGVLIVLRTVIGYFIGKEVEVIEKEEYIDI